MCGIVSIVGSSSSVEELRASVERMKAALAHRGPDGEGIYVDPNGKPVICYIRDGDLRFIPPAMCEDLPIINTTPTTIYAALKEWLTVKRHKLTELGYRSRAYVERWHDPVKIAARLKSEYEAILSQKY